MATWDHWRRDIALPESWLGRGTDCIIDIHASGGPDLPIQTRKNRVDAEALRLRDLGATLLSDLSKELQQGADHYAVALTDSEGNEFDIN